MSTLKEILIPSIGDIEQAEVIKILVAPGDNVAAEEPLITLESDKATMEIPSPHAGIISELKVAVGDKAMQGDLILILEMADEQRAPATKTRTSGLLTPERAEAAPVTPDTAPPSQQTEPAAESKPHASPAVRRISQELGVDLNQVTGSDPKGRILKDDVQLFVNKTITKANRGSGHPPILPEIQVVDHSRFGEIETQPLSRIKVLSGTSLHQSWLTIPHVTQFDEAEDQRKKVSHKMNTVNDQLGP